MAHARDQEAGMSLAYSRNGKLASDLRTEEGRVVEDEVRKEGEIQIKWGSA